MDLFEVPKPALDVAGVQGRFPVHRIYCVGRNYAAHAREMGNDPAREPPFYFMKPADAVVPGGGRVTYPPRTADLHHEIELVVAIGRRGADIPAATALEHVFGYAVGIDLTRRDLQADAKQHGRPWDTGKSFEQAAPVSRIHAAAAIGHPGTGRIWLTVNGELRQEGDLADMIWNVAEAIAELSTYFTLAPGDLLFTGTPAGVGAVARGDRLHGGVEGVDEIEIILA
ncbi:MAG: fumarylacetoacetate hydrolase family protein [Gammaproteobacteria bacterium]|nr:fumarylacetoacetate hydrolase family protein [Gammaproteobacteria bacterium]MDH4254882.1 fumarylacetoacetate hydrolase family protein [Gammaproteobacteria bacterium]MDH5310605.1 fumarylacetoacetate hydrolase family protein [Gammaproteobacteria bacterium]